MGLRDSPTRQDTWSITLILNGVSFGVWDKKDGGEVDSDSSVYYPGAMVPPISLGGRKTTGNVTLSRFYDLQDDHDRINTLLNAVGKGLLTVSQRPLDPDGNPYGRAIIYTGKLKRVTPPSTDSEGQGAAMIEIEMTISGTPSAS